MYGIVTDVEGEAGEQIRMLWAELRQRYRPELHKGHNLPHISHHVTDDYDVEAVRAMIETIASEVAPFDMAAPGIGFVARQHTVLWINVARSPEIAALHERLWTPGSGLCEGRIDHYHTERWFPHATLSDNEAMLQAVPELVRAMRVGRLPESIRIDNLALIEEMPYGHETRVRVELRGARSAAP